MKEEPSLAEIIYRFATKFGGRPYTYVAPELTDPQLQLSIDYAVECVGIRADIRMQQRVRREQSRQARLQKNRQLKR